MFFSIFDLELQIYFHKIVDSIKHPNEVSSMVPLLAKNEMEKN